jgi:hypothetical protein
VRPASANPEKKTTTFDSLVDELSIATNTTRFDCFGKG